MPISSRNKRNQQEQQSFYRHADASIARLDERVDSLNSDLSGIRSDLGEVRKAISALAQAFNDKGRTQWQPLLTAGALVIAIVSMGGSVVGALALSPINEAITENRTIVRNLPDLFVPRGEIAQRWTFADERATWIKERIDTLDQRTRESLQELDRRLDNLQGERHGVAGGL